MSAHDHDIDIDEPTDDETSSKTFLIGGALALIGAVAFLGYLFGTDDQHRAWQAYLIGFWFTLTLGLAGPFIVAINYLSQASWYTSIRRIPEAFGWYLLPATGFGAIALLGADTLLPWMGLGHGGGHGGGHGDIPHHVLHVLELKSGFLNFTGLALSTLIGLAALAGFAFLIQRNSRRQDESGDPSLTERNKTLSTLFLWVFVFALSFLSWYWLMSLEPLWFSTLWQVHTFAGLFQAGLALTAVIVVMLKKQGVFGSFVGENQILSLGQLIFGFTVFYAYVTFCEFMLIWYANIPEETFWFAHRIMGAGGWHWFTILFAIKFVVPFFLLLPQRVKKNAGNMLMVVCGILLGAHFYEIWFWVSFSPDSPDPHVAVGTPPLPWLELLVTLGFVGVFTLTVGWALSRGNIVPIKDPFLHECLPHGHGDDHHETPEDDDAEVQHT